MPDSTKKRTTFKIPEVLFKNFKLYAKHKGRGINEVAEEVFVDFLKNQGIADPLQPIPAPWEKKNANE